MSKIKDFLKSMLVAQVGSISSKRVCGVTGWGAGLAVLFYCTYNKIQAPTFIDTVFYTSTALLGVDSVTGRFYQNRTTAIIESVTKEHNDNPQSPNENNT